MVATVQIVDKVGSGGTVLLDLNRHLSGVMLGRDHQLADVSQAQQSGEQRVEWSPAPAEPTSLTSRQITVPVVLFSATADATASLVSQLRTLTATRFIIRLQRHGATAPVWLRCMPCSPQLAAPMTGRDGVCLIRGSLVAQTEPYALGARVDVGPVAITQDPASGTPYIWDITVSAGDALTPLVLRTADTDVTTVRDRILISTRRRGTPSSLAGLWVQAEGATITPGTAAPTVTEVTGDTAVSGGGCVRATYTAAASGPWTLTKTFTGLTGAEVPGQYRLLVRVRRTGSAAGALFSLIARCGPARLVETVTAGGNDVRVIDLGLVQVPSGAPPYMASPETHVEAGAPTVSLTVVRGAAGEGTLDVDWLALVPADQDCGMLEVSESQGSGQIVLDGWDQTPRLLSAAPWTAGAQALGTSGLTWIGGAPRLRPGTNRLYVVAGLGAVDTRTLALSMDLYGSYWPRYGWLA